jgi:hypothetical protein
VTNPALPRGALWTPPDVQVKRWGEGEAVAYSSDNAKTHIISEAAAHLLGLASGPGLTQDELVRIFCSDDGSEIQAQSEATAADLGLLHDTVNGLLVAGLLKQRP